MTLKLHTGRFALNVEAEFDPIPYNIKASS
jgi:hypothetical protein